MHCGEHQDRESAALAPLSGLTPLGRGMEETRSVKQAGPAWCPVRRTRQAVFQRSEGLLGSGLSCGRRRTGGARMRVEGITVALVRGMMGRRLGCCSRFA